jgi:uncharacterized protein
MSERGTWAAVLTAVAGIAGYYGALEPRRLQVERWRVRIDGLPPAREGLRIVQLSDLHFGMWLSSRSHLRRAISTAVKSRPDLICITGDIMHQGRWHPDGRLLAPLVQAAPTFAVLGNHDQYGSPDDADRITDELRALGITVLRNAHAEVGLDGLPWLIVGVDDWATGNSDLIQAVTGIVPNTRILALLTHVPDVVEHVPQGWFPLVLAGHTHGKRLRVGPLVRIPWVRNLMRIVRTRYPRGFYVVGDTLLYVSRGIGTSEVPVRAGSVPEVTVLELTSGEGMPEGVRYERLGRQPAR